MKKDLHKPIDRDLPKTTQSWLHHNFDNDFNRFTNIEKKKILFLLHGARNIMDQASHNDWVQSMKEENSYSYAIDVDISLCNNDGAYIRTDLCVFETLSHAQQFFTARAYDL